jgi:hypothetical protein
MAILAISNRLTLFMGAPTSLAVNVVRQSAKSNRGSVQPFTVQSVSVN